MDLLARRTAMTLVHALLAIPLLLLLAGCSVSGSTGTVVTGTSSPSSLPTPPPTCGSVLPGAGAINLATAGFAYRYAFPNGTVGTTPAVTASGTGLFIVRQFTACTAASSLSSVQAFFTTQLLALPRSWSVSSSFPTDGGLMRSCAAPCFANATGAPFYYLDFDQFSDHGGGVITYRVRWAVSPSLPTCASYFYYAGGTANAYFVPDFSPPVPVPPLSALQHDDALGGVRGFDVCSPGTVASVTTFMTKELPATGWTQVKSNAGCIFDAECWTQGSTAVSWDAGSGATGWIIAWRVPLS